MAHLEDVVAVVEADADDLVGPGDERREVETLEVERLPGGRLGAVAPRRVGQQGADVGGAQVDRGAGVDPDRRGPRRGADGGQSHRGGSSLSAP